MKDKLSKLLSIPNVTMHTTEPGRGYFLYRDRPGSYGGFSTPWRTDSLESDMESFIEDLPFKLA